VIPVGDSVRSRTFPYVNLTIIGLNVLVFLFELTHGTAASGLVPTIPPTLVSDLGRLFFEWGTLPACLSDTLGFATDVPPPSLEAVCSGQPSVLLTPLTSMFLHGGWLHLIGNMVFLWVFGDNVEDAMGHARYLVFYVTAGFAATAAHVAIGPSDLTPAIGASGAIAGVLGAYLVLYPRANVRAILPFFLLFWLPFYVPAVFLIGLWFAMQLLNGVAALTATDVVNAGGGIAWFAHIGGFAAGVLLVRLFTIGRPRVPYARRLRPGGWS
jgi:membrane associated rhomboid family serine protease